MDLQFSDELFSDVLLSQQFLLDDLDRADKLAFLLPCQEDVPVFACSQFLDLIEIFYAEFLVFLLAPGFFYPVRCGVVVALSIGLDLALAHAAVAAAEGVIRWDAAFGHEGFL